MKQIIIKNGSILTLILMVFISCAEKRDLRGTLTFILSSNVRAQFDPCG
jgi:hypothetical protein